MKKMVIAVGVGLAVVAGMVTLSILSQGKTQPPEATTPVIEKKAHLDEAASALAEGDLLKARQLYQQVMLIAQDADRLDEVKKKLEDINMGILFSPLVDQCSQIYTVKPNDSLSKIARSANTTVGFLKRANKLASDIIRPGQELKVPSCVFSAVVDKSQNVLWLMQSGEPIKTYIVSTGFDNGTPTGAFKIVNKLINPTWYKSGAIIPPDSPDNALGTRWMGFDLKGYGIHGTTEPDKLGQQVTLGCVRMGNEDVEELYDIMTVGSEVTIVE